MEEHVSLSVDDVIELHIFIMERTGQDPAPLYNLGNLEGALQRPAHAVFYGETDIAVCAARLIDGIATAHGFRDGNKRTATIAGVTYLEWNGWYIASPSSDDTTLGRQVEMLVERQDRQAFADFVAWLSRNLREFPDGEL